MRLAAVVGLNKYMHCQTELTQTSTSPTPAACKAALTQPCRSLSAPPAWGLALFVLPHVARLASAPPRERLPPLIH
jgi:hypothetical protein